MPSKTLSRSLIAAAVIAALGGRSHGARIHRELARADRPDGADRTGRADRAGGAPRGAARAAPRFLGTRPRVRSGGRQHHGRRDRSRRAGHAASAAGRERPVLRALQAVPDADAEGRHAEARDGFRPRPRRPDRRYPHQRPRRGERAEGQPAGPRLPAARDRDRAGRPERHGVARLALPRRRPARPVVDLRAGAPPRARRVAREPLRRLPRLRPEPGRRRLLRRQARGLHLEAGRRARGARARRSGEPRRTRCSGQARPDGGIDEEWPRGPEGRRLPGPRVDGASRGRRSRRCSSAGKLWVVEATPRDPVLPLRAHRARRSTQETFQGAGSRKFDAQGALLRSLQFLSYASQPIEAGGETLVMPASSMGYVCAENTKAGRATVAGTTPPGDLGPRAPRPARPGAVQPRAAERGRK